MNLQCQTLDWDAVAPVISRFAVWHESPELAWFKKCWDGVMAAGLADYSNDEERHWGYIRAIALGIMYSDYCQLEWDQYWDAESLVCEVYEDEELSPSRIGNMVERQFDVDESHDMDLFCAMVLDLVGEVRLTVYDAIVREFGDPCMLYVGLFLSREEGNDQDKLDERMDDVFDASYGTKGRDEAWQYVLCGAMLAVDA